MNLRPFHLAIPVSNISQATIEMIQKIVGANIVKPFVDFKKPLADIPRIIAKSKKIYPDKFVIN